MQQHPLQPSVEQLRDYFDRLCEANRSVLAERLDALKQRMDLTDKATEAALQRAYEELQRRLDILNHAHEQAVQDRAAFVHEDVFREIIEKIEDKVGANRSEIDKASGRHTAYIAVGGLALALLQLALKFLP